MHRNKCKQVQKTNRATLPRNFTSPFECFSSLYHRQPLDVLTFNNLAHIHPQSCCVLIKASSAGFWGCFLKDQQHKRWRCEDLIGPTGQTGVYGQHPSLAGINRMHYHRGFGAERPLVRISIFGFSYCGNQSAPQASAVRCCYFVPWLNVEESVFIFIDLLFQLDLTSFFLLEVLFKTRTVFFHINVFF